MQNASSLLQQLAVKGIKVPFMSGNPIKSDAFIELVGKAAEKVYATAPSDVSKNPVAIEAAQEHAEKYGGEPGPYFYEAYAATMALANAIEKAGTTGYEAVRSALVGSKLETPLGAIGFSVDGELIGPGFSVYRVEHRQFVKQP